MVSETAAKKPHAVLVPLPGQGHVNPMLKLGKLLHSRGFHITFVICEIFHRSLPSETLNGQPQDFQFRTIPDGIHLDSPITSGILCSSIQNSCATPFRNLILHLNSAAEIDDPDTPPVSCIITDGTMTCTLEVAHELKVHVAVFWPTSACAYMAFLHYGQLIEKGLLPIKDVNDLETPVDWIPGMKGIRLKDLPSFCRTTELDDITMFHFSIVEARRTSTAPAVIFNTFDELERDVLDALVHINPRIYTIGPLPLICNREDKSSPVASIGLSKWKDDDRCLDWLDGRAPTSVVYVNFGSVAVLTRDQLTEFAWGLANSNHSFLWVVRSGIVKADHDAPASLPSEFLAATKERGFIMEWCAQERVLLHPSIGAFLTHNGWNSTLESISSGVPMICWPFFADQQTNCHYACDKWSVGVEIARNVVRDEVERLVRDVMDGENGKEMRRRALLLRESAITATGKGGSSYVHFESLVADVLMKQTTV